MEVPQGKVVTLLGRNGMGKTTTIRSIIGFTPPREGVIRFKGKDITRVKPYRIAQMGIGLIPQGRQIFPSLSVKENLIVAARTGGTRGSWTLERVYEHFPVLRERSNLKGHLLSGGEQQMLAIGRALMTNPELLLMDEPSEGLAPLIVMEIGNIIRELKESGFSIFLVEQNYPMAMDIADHAYIISKGAVVYEGPIEDLRQNEPVKEMYLCATDGKTALGSSSDLPLGSST